MKHAIFRLSRGTDMLIDTIIESAELQQNPEILAPLLYQLEQTINASTEFRAHIHVVEAPGSDPSPVESMPVPTVEITPRDVLTSLLLVADYQITEEEIAQWPAATQSQVHTWAWCVHTRASDNDDVPVAPKPTIMKTIMARQFDASIQPEETPYYRTDEDTTYFFLGNYDHHPYKYDLYIRPGETDLLTTLRLRWGKEVNDCTRTACLETVSRVYEYDGQGVPAHVYHEAIRRAIICKKMPKPAWLNMAIQRAEAGTMPEGSKQLVAVDSHMVSAVMNETEPAPLQDEAGFDVDAAGERIDSDHNMHLHEDIEAGMTRTSQSPPPMVEADLSQLEFRIMAHAESGEKPVVPNATASPTGRTHRSEPEPQDLPLTRTTIPFSLQAVTTGRYRSDRPNLAGQPKRGWATTTPSHQVHQILSMTPAAASVDEVQPFNEWSLAQLVERGRHMAWMASNDQLASRSAEMMLTELCDRLDRAATACQMAYDYNTMSGSQDPPERSYELKYYPYASPIHMEKVLLNALQGVITKPAVQ